METSERYSKGVNNQKPFSKLLKDKICRIKQFLDYVLINTRQIILGTLMTFLSQLKVFMKTLYLGDNFQNCHT